MIKSKADLKNYIAEDMQFYVPSLCFQKTTTTADQKWVWKSQKWGYIQLPEPKILSRR